MTRMANGLGGRGEEDICRGCRSDRAELWGLEEESEAGAYIQDDLGTR
jgi:hypothetical protein